MSRSTLLAFILFLPSAARPAGAGRLVLTHAPCALKHQDGSAYGRPLKTFECDFIRVAARGRFDALDGQEAFVRQALPSAEAEHVRYLERIKRLVADSDPSTLPPNTTPADRLRFVRAWRSKLVVEAVGAAQAFLWPAPGSAAAAGATAEKFPDGWRRYVDPALAHMPELEAQTGVAEKALVDAAAARRRTLPRMTGPEPSFDLGGVDSGLVTAGANPASRAGGRPVPVISAATIKGPPTRIIVLPPSSYRTTSAESWGSAFAKTASAQYHGLLASLGLDAPKPAPRPLPRADKAALPQGSGKSCWFCDMPLGPALPQIPSSREGRAKRNYFSRGADAGIARLNDDFNIEVWHAWRTTKTIGDPYGLARLIFQQVGQTCAVQAQYEALRAAGKPANQKRLVEEAVRLKVFKPEIGTMPDKMNALLNAHGLKNRLILNASMSELDAAVKADGRAIISVDVQAFWGVPYGGGHAVFITGAELEQGGGIRGYYFNDTGGGEGARFVSTAVLKKSFTGTVVALPRS